MAFLSQDDKQQQQGQDPNAQSGGQGQAGAGFAGGASSGGGTSVSPGGQNSGPGAGGTGAWTNLQSYLTANAGNTGSADYLKSQVGNSFNQEGQQASSQASQAKQQGQGQLDSQMGQDQASKLLSQASQNYSYGSQPQNSAYQDATGQLKTGLTQKYGGPTSFNYQMGNQAQNYGQNLGSDQGFNALMNGMYDRAAGGQMNSGAKMLQQQLDNNNQAVRDARQSLMSQYSGLGNQINQTNQDTTAALQGDAAKYGQNESALKDYLSGRSKNDLGQIDQQVQGAQSQEDKFKNWVNQNDSYNSYQRGRQYISPQQIAAAQNVYNAPTEAVNRNNVSGVDSQKSEFNTLRDVLGLNDAQVTNQDNYTGGTANVFGGFNTRSLGDPSNPYSINADPTSPFYMTNQTADFNSPVFNSVSAQDFSARGADANNPALARRR